MLVDQIDVEIKSGKERYQSIIDSGVSRMNPVSPVFYAILRIRAPR